MCLFVAVLVCVDCCLRDLLVVYCVLRVGCCLFVVCGSSCVVAWLLLVLCVVCCSRGACLFVVRCWLCVVCCVLCVLAFYLLVLVVC